MPFSLGSFSACLAWLSPLLGDADPRGGLGIFFPLGACFPLTLTGGILGTGAACGGGVDSADVQTLRASMSIASGGAGVASSPINEAVDEDGGGDEGGSVMGT